ALTERFGVSRTVIREAAKRLEEKGLVVVAQGRGTQVARSSAWNMLDPLVLGAMIDNDSSLSMLDDLTVVRGTLEAAMAGAVATRRSEVELSRIEHALVAMQEAEHENDAFRQADALFHFTMMELSGNRLAANIARSLYGRALTSSRFQGLAYPRAFESTLEEHTRVVDAIRARDAEAAETAMRHHIFDSWQQRRFESEDD
ncbi:FadR/GntR family transcriptional regulator, partial [Mesorhizobium japonicum]|uniref:FadR/GntR family transcriptional regulator n=1 Tax=Mesorhizobium japonicum TaxID=2066070 RepID=UPI003B5A539B